VKVAPLPRIGIFDFLFSRLLFLRFKTHIYLLTYPVHNEKYYIKNEASSGPLEAP
jgi:hypothetical protein